MSFRHRKPYKIKYSQNFLKDQAAIYLINQMYLDSNDIVVEIGPGTGQLTKLLLQRVKFVLAIEKDPQLAAKISQRFRGYSNFVCINADFLTWELPLTTFKVVGNIPFANTAEIMHKLIRHQSPPPQSYLLMQHEAAQKFAGNPRETLFSLQCKPLYEIQLTKRVPRSSFTPEPNVDAALLTIQLRQVPLFEKQKLTSYLKFIENIYADFQPSAAKALRKYFSTGELSELSRRLKLDLTKRRSNITFDQWLKLFESLNDS